MANLNLSQFSEKLFVTDADHTFIWDTVGAISKRVSRNSWLNSGTLTSDAPVTISQTWNNAAVAFTGLKVNATSTASASGSLLLDLQVGGVSQASFNKDGRLLIVTQGGASTPSILIGSGAGFYQPTNTQISFSSNTLEAIRFTNAGIRLGLNELGFGSAFNVSPDTILLRDGVANTLALRNGAGVPQTFRVYNTFLGTTANEWFEIDWKTSAGTVRLFTMHGGTGVARNIDISAGGTLYFGAGTSSPIRMYSNGVERWNISATGHFIAAADNTYDIGASGANRPRDIYAGGNGIFGGLISALNGFRAPSSSQLIASANGIWRLTNSSADDFNRLQFGGTTDVFPAIARDGAGIKFTGAAAGSTAWIKVPPVAVGSLPVAATAGAGARAFVNDALAPTFGSAVTGGGAVLVPVYCTGSAWNVG